MTITGGTPEGDKPKAEAPAEKGKRKAEDKEQKENIFSDKELMNDVKVDTGKPEPKDMDLGRMNRSITITPEDKVAFIDSVVNNTRFTRDYSLFGGRVSLTVRSMTTDEVNALAAWTLKQGVEDPNGLSAGRYRKFLAAAQVARLNGVDMPPLETPLFQTLAADGKTVEPPGWLKRCGYWDNMGTALFGSVMECLADFDLRYSMLCRKAEDANFWNPDTP